MTEPQNTVANGARATILLANGWAGMAAFNVVAGKIIMAVRTDPSYKAPELGSFVMPENSARLKVVGTQPATTARCEVFVVEAEPKTEGDAA